MKLKLEVGKYYVNRFGRKVGPAKAYCDKGFIFNVGELLFFRSGRPYDPWSNPCCDLVSEWVEPKVEPDVLPFGKLTPVEQGALMVAHRNGETLEYYSLSRCGWYGAYITYLSNGGCYRIKPKPKMQAEYWVVFRDNGIPLLVAFDSRCQPDKGYYKVHYPAVEIKE